MESGARGRWLTVGQAEDGIEAARYDADRGAVLLRCGAEERWLTLRRGLVAVLPTVRTGDGGIDYAHMAMTDREKEQRAAIQHWELMEITRLARQDASAPPRPGRVVTGPTAGATGPRKTSPVR
jgi:hypothetical protein